MASLPPVSGPQLHAFSTEPVDIDFIRELGKGQDSIVFKASIKGLIYALKIFKRPSKIHTVLRYGVEAPQKEALYLTAPFYSECRAYGRLKELKLERLAVKCHGYIQLDQKHLDEFKEKCSSPIWEVRPYQVPDEPLFAIVKDLIEIQPKRIERDEVGHMSAYFTNKTLPRMVSSLRKMHKVGIWVRDVHYKNYHAGILIDFSRAWTMPHPYLKREIMDDESKIPPEESLVMDAVDMDGIIDWWNEIHTRDVDKVWVRMLPNEDYIGKTRVGGVRPIHDMYPHRPDEYDWQATERVGEPRSRKKQGKEDGPKKTTTKRGKRNVRLGGRKGSKEEVK